MICPLSLDDERVLPNVFDWAPPMPQCVVLWDHHKHKCSQSMDMSSIPIPLYPMKHIHRLAVLPNPFCDLFGIIILNFNVSIPKKKREIKRLETHQ